MRAERAAPKTGTNVSAAMEGSGEPTVDAGSTQLEALDEGAPGDGDADVVVVVAVVVWDGDGDSTDDIGDGDGDGEVDEVSDTEGEGEDSEFGREATWASNDAITLSYPRCKQSPTFQ